MAAKAAKAAGSLLAALAVLAALAALATVPATAQQPSQDLEASKRRLEEIRREREKLRSQQRELEGQVHDVGAELSNIERQRETTGRIVNEIDRQIGGLNSQLDRSTAELLLAEDNLAERQAILERRLVDIYKRGELYAFQAIFAAESFADLLSRYKYLYLTSRQDRALLHDVQNLRGRVNKERNTILGVRSELDRSREQREAELQRFGALANERTRKLAQLKTTAQTTEKRLTALERDEAKLNDLLAALEKTRRTESATRPGRTAAGAAAGSITTADLGKLDWPVEGQIIYRFGRDTLPSGGVIRWNGVGIAAPVGTPVKAVEAGTVGLVQRLSTYGLTVVIEHGNGYYSVYSHLQDASVQPGTTVTKGQAIGTVGGENSDQGPHLHFEIRGENQIALDPTDWLRRRR